MSGRKMKKSKNKFFNDLMEALQEAVDHSHGKITLETSVRRRSQEPKESEKLNTDDRSEE